MKNTLFYNRFNIIEIFFFFFLLKITTNPRKIWNSHGFNIILNLPAAHKIILTNFYAQIQTDLRVYKYHYHLY